MSPIPEIPTYLQSLAAEAPTNYLATNPEHQRFVQDAAVAIQEDDATRENHDAVVDALLAWDNGIPLALHLAAKLAKSRNLVANLKEPVRLSVVFAVYKENHRLLRPEEHEAGEDFLRRKVAQLDWLASASTNLSWELLAVDDGCPESSGRLIERMAKEEGFENVRVLYLEEAIRQNLPIAGKLESTDQSRKGGSIIYGLWEASRKTEADKDQIVLFTDADLSTHLGQAGLLIDPILNEGKEVAMGSRRETTSVVVKKGTRNLRGKLFIYLWKRMLSPALLEIIDTQCGFKAFRAETARSILDDLLERGFSFDVELLLKAEQRNADGLAKVPIAWIDSEAESTTTALSPYLTMLQSIAAMNRKYLPANPEAGAFVNFIESLDETQWNRLVDNVPEPIATGDPQRFGHFDEVSIDALRSILQEKRA